jgi:RimJ/RimL family protein N-acetyltransferase
MATTATLPLIEPNAYPRELERQVVLDDGAHVFIRPIRADDAPRLIEFYTRLSRETAYLRFFTVMKRLPPDWARLLATVDYHRRLALIAERDTATGAELIGVARWEPTKRDDEVEIAFVVQDAWQGKGLGKILLAELMRAASTRGIHRFVAWVLADNSRMLNLLNRHTRIERRALDSGVLEIVFTPRTE